MSLSGEVTLAQRGFTLDLKIRHCFPGLQPEVDETQLSTMFCQYGPISSTQVQQLGIKGCLGCVGWCCFHAGLTEIVQLVVVVPVLQLN